VGGGPVGAAVAGGEQGARAPRGQLAAGRACHLTAPTPAAGPRAGGMQEYPRQKRTRHMGRGGQQLAPPAMPYGPPAAGPRLHSWQLVEGGTALEVSLAIGGRMFRGRLGNIGGMPLVEEELLVGAAPAPAPAPACCPRPWRFWWRCGPHGLVQVASWCGRWLASAAWPSARAHS
jgi:hypothetical protein